MRHTTVCTATLNGTIDSIWATWTDMTSYPRWGDREDSVTLDGPFAEGVTGRSRQTGAKNEDPFVVTRVEPTARWTNETPLPGGKLVLDHTLSPTADGHVTVTKTYTAHGPVSPLFRIWFARGIRRDMPAWFTALQVEAARRVQEQTDEQST